MGTNIPKYIRSLRAKLGMTQAQLAKALHVTEQTVYYWERGLAAPSRYDALVLERLNTMSRNPADLARAQQALTRSAEAVQRPKPAPTDDAAAALIGGVIGFGLGLLLAELFGGSGSRGGTRSARKSGNKRPR